MPNDRQPRSFPRALQPFAARPRLLVGLAVGVAAYFIGGLTDARIVTRSLVAWDCGVIVFLAMIFASMIQADQTRMKRRAIEQDEGKHTMLLITVGAAIASIAAIAAELATAKSQSHGQEALRIALTAGTIVLSWTFVHMVFALHYAHVYYLADSVDNHHRRGLDFPCDADPDYWDFVHFSIIIGATAQTADITIVSQEMRRTGTVHSLIAFTFNTAILAVMINLVANLF